MSFLPEGETIPSGESRYMKLGEPENRFRVLDSAIVGYELWVAGKPVRKKTRDQFDSQELINADINKFNGKRKLPQYFWAFPVFNYKTERVEILELTQKTVMHGIQDYLDDSDYGDPKEYDLIVIRDESGEKVEYRVKAKPAKKLDPAITKLYQDMEINMNAFYMGEDPFNSEIGINVDEVSEELDKQD